MREIIKQSVSDIQFYGQDKVWQAIKKPLAVDYGKYPGGMRRRRYVGLSVAAVAMFTFCLAIVFFWSYIFIAPKGYKDTSAVIISSDRPFSVIMHASRGE